jgi:hypothetical protein
MTAKPNSLESFKISYEFTEDIIDYKALIARINLKRQKRAAK